MILVIIPISGALRPPQNQPFVKPSSSCHPLPPCLHQLPPLPTFDPFSMLHYPIMSNKQALTSPHILLHKPSRIPPHPTQSSTSSETKQNSSKLTAMVIAN